MLKRMVDYLSLGLGILALGAAVTAVYFGWQANKQARENARDIRAQVLSVEDVSPQRASQDALMTLRQAQRAQEKAEDASNAANIILGFIESGSILIGALIALGAVVFGMSIQDVRTRMDKSVSQAQDLLNSTDQRMRTLEEDMREQLAEAVRADEDRLHQSEAVFAALTQKIEDSLGLTEKRVSGLQESINTALDAAQKEAERSFRVLSLLLLAEQQVRSRNRETAIATLEDAYALDPTNQTTNYLLGYLYVGRKQFQKAVDHLQRALTSNANFAPALAAMGLAQSRMADQEKENVLQRNQYRAEAELNLTKALNSDPALIDADNESYFGTLGGLYRRQGRNEDALRAYESAVNITPNNSYPVGNLALLAKKLGHEEQALKTYNKVIEIAETILDDHPDDTWARLDLAQAYLVTGNMDKALYHYRDAFQRITTPGPLESALNGLHFLETSPVAIPNLDKAIEMMQQQITKLSKEK